MILYRKRFYVMQTIPGISGFQRWDDEREYRVVSGAKAMNNRADIVAEWTPMEDEQYMIENGQLPEHQPVVDKCGVAEFLWHNPYACTLAIGKAHDRLHGRHGRIEQ